MDSQISSLIQKLTPESLDPVWVKALVMQESDGNPNCIRYEPTYRYVFEVEKFALHPQISVATELVTQKMSWGLGQVMGGLAREQGHIGLMGELLNPEVNLQHVCKRLMYLKTMSLDISDMFAMYNGGPGAIHKVNGRYRNQPYVNSVFTHLQKLKR